MAMRGGWRAVSGSVSEEFTAGVDTQGISGSIKGALLDPASAPVPNVEVTPFSLCARGSSWSPHRQEYF